MGAHEAQPEANKDPWWTLHVDALTRAWRTLYTGFILDALTIIGGGILDLLTTTVDVTSEVFWIGVLGLVTKSFLTALGSYLLRLKVTPKNVQKEGRPV